MALYKFCPFASSLTLIPDMILQAAARLTGIIVSFGYFNYTISLFLTEMVDFSDIGEGMCVCGGGVIACWDEWLDLL